MTTIGKKMRVVVLVCLLVLLAVPVTSKAAEGTTITFGQVSGKTGEVVEVPVKLLHPMDLVAYGVELHFDQKALEIVGVKDTYGSGSEAGCEKSDKGCIWYSYKNADGMIRVAWADSSAGDHAINKDVVLFRVQFLIKDGKRLNDKSLSIQAGNKEAFSFTGGANNELPVAVETGILSNNAHLAGLKTSAGNLNFGRETLKYALSVKNSVEALTFVATGEDELATITINGKKVVSGKASWDLPLKVGANIFAIEVTAEDGTKLVYEVVVTRSAAGTIPGDQNHGGGAPGNGSGSGDDGNSGDGATGNDSDQINSGNGGDDAVPGSDDKAENGGGDEASNGGKLPRTGDDSYIDTFLNIGIAVLAAAFVSMWLVYKRRKGQES